MKNNHQKTRSLEVLKERLDENNRVYTLIKHVSRSGMSRIIKFYFIKENHIFDISYHVAEILGYEYNQARDGVKVKGCDMDMCHATVYHIASILFGDGYKLRTGYL